MKNEKTSLNIRKLKKQVKGITLIALVVTIIVLLILAGIALSLTIGQNGIFSRAQKAANTWRNAETNEQLAMGELGDWIDSVSGEKDSNDETEPTYTNIFAQLYDNGDGTETLVFTSDENYREEGLTYEHSWDITDKHFDMGDLPPWLDASSESNLANTTIKTVKIVNEIKPKYTSCMFSYLTALEDIERMENLNTENTEDMSCMFYACISILNLDLSSFDTENVTNMVGMFGLCQSLISLDLSNFDTRNVTHMASMFLRCSSLIDLDLSSFDTKNVTNMNGMFLWCSSLIELDLSSFDTENVTDMISMFEDCTNLSTIYVGPNWKTAAETARMFSGCGTKKVTPKP